MHVEMPKKGALASMKAFSGEFAMIVVSILTALALEHAAQLWHHRHRAQVAQLSIETELRANLEELRVSMRRNQLEADRLAKLRKVLHQDIRDKADNKLLLRHLVETSEGQFGLRVQTPTFRREAWEVAIASQAASWIEPSRLQRFAGAYALQRDTALSTSDGLKLMLDAPALLNKSADVDFGTVDGTGIYYAIIQLQGTLQNTQNNLEELEKELVRALPKA
ncbi:MAG: hypothetical protein K0R43_2574 [Pseudoduganella sp.]|jgi:hypothetical protein|nr:hypothetical protein [Pseudoduganella sp.]